MEERYLRNIGAVSEGELERLRCKKVFVAGCGGLGGYIIDMLLRIGVGAIAVADGDVFEESNLNRQLLADVCNIGRSKAETAAEYARRVNPDVLFTADKRFIAEDNALEMLSDCDVVLDALDNVEARRIVAGACESLDIPMIYGAVQGWSVQCGISLPGDGMMDKLYPEEYEASDKSVLAFTPALCASMQTALCVKLLCGREVDCGRIYFADLLDMEAAGMDML